ncbi:signal peptide, CUB and EGF-like domain-containing protein 3 isoform X2 [Hydra vulgaris]|uniref:Signal peptide, CUB and EGF-like domain-containing protein 3 isoform X2 n=1 Tax=Hydra vulgaris TaxID=6087 RepID=A0ABM4BM62_HYDVU
MAFNGFVKIINILFFGLRQVQLQTYSTSTIYSTATGDPCTFRGCDQICKLVSGKAVCLCLIGKLQADNKTCTEDFSGPCSINRGGCDQICKEILGKAECSCYSGVLQPDGKTCKQDYNPCLIKNGRCDQLCRTYLGKAVCSCIYGKLQPNGKTCKDDLDFSNPCLFNRGGCNQICKRESGKAICSCYNGMLPPDGKTCKEGILILDEMACIKGGCSQKCSVVFGKAVCSCYNGNLNSDGKTCDKDACTNKGCSHSCYKNQDSIICSCPPELDLQPDELICLKSNKGSSQSIRIISIGVIVCCIIVIICYIINYQRKINSKRTSAQALREMHGLSTDVVVRHFFETQNSDIEQQAPNCHDNLNEDLGVINMGNTNNSAPPYDLVDQHPPPSYESIQFSNSITVFSSNEHPPMYSE